MRMSDRARTRTRTAAIAIAAVGALTFAGAGAANADPPANHPPAIPLTIGQEVPKPDATGAHGSFSYTIAQGIICYTLEVTGLSTPATAAHIHLAPRNVAGPVVIPLTVDNETSFEIETCNLASDSVLEALAANPKNYYINVHTSQNPAGEIRGQLKWQLKVNGN